MRLLLPHLRRLLFAKTKDILPRAGTDGCGRLACGGVSAKRMRKVKERESEDGGSLNGRNSELQQQRDPCWGEVSSPQRTSNIKNK
jgi:hypothetical protein